MTFTAHYSKTRLMLLAAIGLAFIAGGYWMAMQPASEFNDGGSDRLAGLAAFFGTETATMGHIIGWMCIAMGLLVLPVIWSNLRHSGPAMRIDADGIFWHRWSDTPIPWTNVAELKPYSISGQKMVGLSLVDRSLSPARGAMGRLSGLNKGLGFGDLALTLQGTDGRYENMLAALTHFQSEAARGP